MLLRGEGVGRGASRRKWVGSRRCKESIVVERGEDRKVEPRRGQFKVVSYAIMCGGDVNRLGAVVFGR